MQGCIAAVLFDSQDVHRENICNEEEHELSRLRCPYHPPPPHNPCTSTASSKHGSPSDRRSPDRSFRFPLVGTALTKNRTLSDRRFSDFHRVLAQGAGGGRPGQRVEKQGTWASHTQKHSEAGYGRPVDRGAWTAAHPQYANYWAPLTRKRHIPPHPAQPQHTNDGAPRTRKRHQQEHRPQRPTERSDPTQHAKGRTGDCPGPRKETATRRNVTQGGGGNLLREPDMTPTLRLR